MSDQESATTRAIMGGKGQIWQLVSDMINLAGWMKYSESRREEYFRILDRNGSKVKRALEEIERISREKDYADILEVLKNEKEEKERGILINQTKEETMELFFSVLMLVAFFSEIFISNLIFDNSHRLIAKAFCSFMMTLTCCSVVFGIYEHTEVAGKMIDYLVFSSIMYLVIGLMYSLELSDSISLAKRKAT